MLAGQVSTYQFKRVKPGEETLILQWIKRYYAYDHIRFDEAKISEALPSLLESDHPGFAYFVNLSGVTVGYFIVTLGFDLEFGGKIAIVTDLFFDEEARRSGAGRASLKFIEEICLKKNISHLELQVETDNYEAQAFYQKSGFQTLTRHILVRELKQDVP